jgi:predicted ArsR family transcriptional regulator
MTADELARQLGISQVAVRQHLASLEAENSITVRIERHGPGRPLHRYMLTPHGDEIFPRHYDALTNDLLEELRAWQGEESVLQLFGRQRERIEQTLLPRMKGKSLEARVSELTRIQTENDYMAEMSADDSGTFRLVEYNCPYRAIAHNHPNTCCAAELELFRRLLPDAEIVREHYLLDGAHNCQFHIRPHSSTTKRCSQE